MNGLRRHIAVLLLALMFISLAPRTVVHLFAGHEDTQCFRTDKSVLDQTHHHCEILSVAVPVFTAVAIAPFSAGFTFTKHFFVPRPLHLVSLRAIYAISLRGPPMT